LRLWIGIGFGQLRPQVDVLQRAIAELRDVLPRGTRIVVAAMRPRVCRLGGALPEQLLDARRWVQEGADEAGRAAPLVGSYVRVALASGSRERLAPRNAATGASTSVIASTSLP
jgi:hypothetical protein